MGACHGCLGRKRGSPGTSPVVAWGGGANGCSQKARSGSGNDLSFGENEFLRKTNLKEGGEWMRRRIIRLPTPFIW
jgi:hypothetical protein